MSVEQCNAISWEAKLGRWGGRLGPEETRVALWHQRGSERICGCSRECVHHDSVKGYTSTLSEPQRQAQGGGGMPQCSAHQSG
jgi:hypothetical protein